MRCLVKIGAIVAIIIGLAWCIKGDAKHGLILVLIASVYGDSFGGR